MVFQRLASNKIELVFQEPWILVFELKLDWMIFNRDWIYSEIKVKWVFVLNTSPKTSLYPNWTDLYLLNQPALFVFEPSMYNLD